MRARNQSNREFSRLTKIICGASSIIAFLVAWQVLVIASPVVHKLLPGPVQTIYSFIQSFFYPIGKYTMGLHLAVSLGRVLLGYILASIVGILVGVLMGWYKGFRAVVKPFIDVCRPIPAIAWIPISILWFGLGEVSRLFILFLSAFLVVVQNSFDGARRTDPVLIGAAKMLGAEERYIFRTIVLPGAVPQIFAGLQNALSVAWMAVLATEMIRSTEGIGWIIVMGMNDGNTLQILVGMIAISLMGFLLSITMRGVERKLCRWNIRGA